MFNVQFFLLATSQDFFRTNSAGRVLFHPQFHKHPSNDIDDWGWQNSIYYLGALHLSEFLEASPAISMHFQSSCTAFASSFSLSISFPIFL
jgi:hypothetical protein